MEEMKHIKTGQSGDGIKFIATVDEYNEKQLTRLINENIELKKEIERLKAEREWISVKDRLPEFGEEYNCVQILEDGGPPVTSITEFDAIKKIFCYPGTDIEQEGITHWMPLPEPPKQ